MVRTTLTRTMSTSASIGLSDAQAESVGQADEDLALRRDAARRSDGLPEGLAEAVDVDVGPRSLGRNGDGDGDIGQPVVGNGPAREEVFHGDRRQGPGGRPGGEIPGQVRAEDDEDPGRSRERLEVREPRREAGLQDAARSWARAPR